ncbi:hypothetical protein GGI19_004877 [Coemansia pectinata]|uniref:Uncharacterized protein n=1 Tax=Coemansia pectinata TaxID=1052879 RepID=A0A9W8GXT5_9FUNG|nr:hypothetical protein GGI19_004877 [Coemansia pectinata]
MSTIMTSEQRVSKVFQLLETADKKEHTVGKMLPLDHALRTAQLAKNEGSDEETILAALFLNIGHFVPPPEQWSDARGPINISFTVVDVVGNISAGKYDKVGAEYLRQLGFSQKTYELVGSQALAIPFIVDRIPPYQRTPGTIAVKPPTFTSPLSSTEMREFKNDPLFDQKVQLVKWSDAATKTTEVKPPTLDAYRDMAIRNVSMGMRTLY